MDATWDPAVAERAIGLSRGERGRVMGIRSAAGRALLLLGFVVACASPVSLTSLPDDHAASAHAQEAPMAHPGALLLAGAEEPTSTASDAPPSTPAPAGSGAAAQAAYHCPMHPDVTSAVPGHCPICGMALVKAPDR